MIKLLFTFVYNYVFIDVFMNINQGKFRQNGNCGYVLKPNILRKMTTETGTHTCFLFTKFDVLQV